MFILNRLRYLYIYKLENHFIYWLLPTCITSFIKTTTLKYCVAIFIYMGCLFQLYKSIIQLQFKFKIVTYEMKLIKKNHYIQMSSKILALILKLIHYSIR